MLIIKGKVLDVTVETVNAKDSQYYDPNKATFDATTIHLLVGKGARTRNQQVGTAKDFPARDLPKPDDQVELEVLVSAFNSKAGGGYRLTAVERLDKGLRVASPVSATA